MPQEMANLVPKVGAFVSRSIISASLFRHQLIESINT